jgi:hypothetical protein
MNKLVIVCFLAFSAAFGQKEARSQLVIPPKQVVQINYPLYKGFNVKIWNESKFVVGVTARDQVTDSIVKSFGLEKGGTTLLEVNEGLFLQFENRFLAPIKVAYALRKGSSGKKKSTEPLTPQRAFYLENNTAQSLPLRIPGVMNPKPQSFFPQWCRFTQWAKNLFRPKREKDFNSYSNRQYTSRSTNRCCYTY